MGCKGSPEIYFDFQNDKGKTYLKIRPLSMQFDRTRGKFDYCKAEFSQEVANEIRPHLGNSQSFLRQPIGVVLHIEGEPVYRLLWVPDGVTFGEDNVHIEFHDPQKYLTRGVIDWRRENVRLKDAYKYVFQNRKKSGSEIFGEIKFTIPSESYIELIASQGKKLQTLSFYKSKIDNYESFEGNLDDLIAYSGPYSTEKRLEEENVYDVIQGHTVINFDKISPWECITKLNEKFGVRTWAAPDGNLWVGSRKATGYNHVAAPDDRRVWKLSNYNVTANRDPVVKSVIRGGWTNDPSENWLENGAELLNKGRGTEDFRIEAVASIGSESFLGQEMFEERIDAKKDNLEEIAKRKMMNKQREQQTGYLEILPELSGNKISNIRNVAIGDSILTIPPDDDKNDDSICDTNIQTELFDVVGVQHELEGGEWKIRLDVVKKLDDELDRSNIETEIRYYDPFNKEEIEKDQYSNMLEEDEEDFWPDFI